jgi:hypothetical protein
MLTSPWLAVAAEGVGDSGDLWHGRRVTGAVLASPERTMRNYNQFDHEFRQEAIGDLA